MDETMIPRQKVPCKLCGEPTDNCGTENCDRCWEVVSRVRDLPAPALARLATLVARRLAGERV